MTKKNILLSATYCTKHHRCRLLPKLSRSTNHNLMTSKHRTSELQANCKAQSHPSRSTPIFKKRLHTQLRREETRPPYALRCRGRPTTRDATAISGFAFLGWESDPIMISRYHDRTDCCTHCLTVLWTIACIVEDCTAWANNRHRY